MLLVDVYSHTNDAVLDHRALQGVLYQDARQLAVLPIDVVGPLDAEVTDILS